MAPSADFIAHSFLPMLHRMGGSATLAIERVGFMPAGGGSVRVEVAPSQLLPIRIADRGALHEVRIEALLSGLPRHIAERELTVVQRRLRLRSEQLRVVERPRGEATGNALHALLRFQHVQVTVQALGRRRVTAEQVAEGLCNDVRRHLLGPFAVDEYLADQLLLPLVCAGGGEFTTGTPSAHLRSNASLIEAFGAARIGIEPAESDPARQWRVRVDVAA